MLQVYSIKNEVTGFFNRPIYVNSQQEALNMIQNILVTDKDKALFGLKKDLSLYFIGNWDDVNGIFIPYTEPDQFYSPKNLFICTLEEIFNSIPDEIIKPALTRDDIKACVDKIRALSSAFDELRNSYESHYHPVKKGVPYNDQKKL